MITGHVYDNAPWYRIEERQSKDEPGPAITWRDDPEIAATIAQKEAAKVSQRGAHGIWYAVVHKDTGEVTAAFES
jgi:hypothetical protein